MNNDLQRCIDQLGAGMDLIRKLLCMPLDSATRYHIAELWDVVEQAEAALFAHRGSMGVPGELSHLCAKLARYQAHEAVERARGRMPWPDAGAPSVDG
ncbi:hypothetical protein [Paraburkholderia caffeinilytica]|uniref:hypothetical protein n=1 Tax=Paraburkholderia caffeinilytica TaxID=1761016 RepID=UPI003DA04C2E